MHNLRLKIFYCLSKTVSVHDPSPSERSTLISYDNKSESWGGGHFPPFRYFPNFQHHQNTCYLLNTTFIFDRCRRSKAVATPVKYECDSMNLSGNFAKMKYFHNGEIYEWGVSNPIRGHPGAKAMYSEWRHGQKTSSYLSTSCIR